MDIRKSQREISIIIFILITIVLLPKVMCYLGSSIVNYQNIVGVVIIGYIISVYLLLYGFKAYRQYNEPLYFVQVLLLSAINIASLMLFSDGFLKYDTGGEILTVYALGYLIITLIFIILLRKYKK